MTSVSPLGLRRLRRVATQFGVLSVAAGLLFLLGLTVRQGFAARGVEFSFSFLAASAGFEISEGTTLDGFAISDFTASMTNTQALIAGLSNTLKVAFVAIALATVLGVAMGVCRLSTNWLVRSLAFWLTEFLRNTPLLIQLTFWYVAVVLQLPALRDAPHFWGAIISQQGMWLPYPVLAGQGGTVFAGVAAGAALVGVMPVSRKARFGALAVSAVLTAIAVLSGFRVAIDFPEAGRFRASGGVAISPEYAALLIAITANSAAYISEIVRGAIEALPRGQWEAADAIGLSRRHVLGDVVLPQVFRVVMPSFGNQYISLAKNTSLGIAIGYPDLFNVYGTVSNQTGRSLEGVLLAMGIYLGLSWVISFAVNLVNRRMKIPGVR